MSHHSMDSSEGGTVLGSTAAAWIANAAARTRDNGSFMSGHFIAGTSSRQFQSEEPLPSRRINGIGNTKCAVNVKRVRQHRRPVGKGRGDVGGGDYIESAIGEAIRASEDKITPADNRAADHRLRWLGHDPDDSCV